MIKQIAAAGLKPPSTKPNPTSHDTQSQQIPSSPPHGSNIVSHSTGSHPPQFTPRQKKFVPLMAKEQRSTSVEDSAAPPVSVQDVDIPSVQEKKPIAADGMLAPVSDEAGTQVSSSSGSVKPPSLGGKSSASMFALDEKESLRPDDSASVKAGEDEDLFSPSGSVMPGSRLGSEDGTRAFRDQLREISRMDPSRQGESRPNIARGSSQGVLYVPPQGPGIGSVTEANRDNTSQDPSIECPPDPRLLEALESPKDRIMVLKLEQDFVDFVKDPKEASLTLPQLNGYHRMLAHRLADYYMLGHLVEDSTVVQIYKTATCRLAPALTAIAPPSTAASTPPPTGPQMKILRRSDNVGPTIANGSNMQSKTGSETGESGNDDEKKSKYPLPREEREAIYAAARKRIMGSAKPSEAPEEPLEKDNSRSSSTAPKKAKKKARNDSDDDFEARSAYSAYYTTPFTSAGASSAPYGFVHPTAGQHSQFPQPEYGHQAGATGVQQYGPPAGAPWQNQAAFQQQQHHPSPWMPNVQQSYDLNNDFQRSMSLQSPSMQSPQASGPGGWQPQQNSSFAGAQQTWQGQSPYTSGYPAHAAQPFGDNFRPSSSSSQAQNQPYAYGQLPSQTFPGRPPSNLEHPLPGSYKGKHFNPQSQSFVPTFNPPQSRSMPMQPFASQFPQAGNVPYGSYGATGHMQQQPNTFQPQQAPYQQHSPFQQHQQPPPQQPPQYQQYTAAKQHHVPVVSNQAQQASVPSTAHRSPGQPLTHPLPQPVFPRQPSPNMPLPPKPDTTPPRPNDHDARGSYGQQQQQQQQQQKESTIAKWGAPSSLPAKPPPAVEPFDPAKFAHNQRQSSQGARIPSNSSTYGQVPGGGSGRLQG